jgi:carbon monoxide dehydrogenase subunit G
MLTKILIGVAVVLVLLVIVIATRPTRFRYVRSTKIAAPPATVFALVNNFRRWQTWSPWENLDPNLQRTYEGPSSGAGAVYSWVGNKNVGEGRMTLVESRPNERIDLKLEFFKPFTATNSADFVFKPVGDQTEVTWSMEGDYNFMTKAIGLVMNMEKMCGGQFEEGLAKMKQVAESESKVVVQR